jgi:hypothetical protein
MFAFGQEIYYVDIGFLGRIDPDESSLYSITKGVVVEDLSHETVPHCQVKPINGGTERFKSLEFVHVDYNSARLYALSRLRKLKASYVKAFNEAITSLEKQV